MSENAVHVCLSVHVKKFSSDQKTLKSQFKKDLNLQIHIKFRYSEKATKFEKNIFHCLKLT